MYYFLPCHFLASMVYVVYHDLKTQKKETGATTHCCELTDCGMEMEYLGVKIKLDLPTTFCIVQKVQMYLL